MNVSRNTLIGRSFYGQSFKCKIEYAGCSNEKCARTFARVIQHAKTIKVCHIMKIINQILKKLESVPNLF